MAHATRLGAFYLQAPIGKGGMGAVWKGVHLHQRVPVAVKVLSLEQAREPRALRRFRQEVRAVASLHHDSIVSVLDHGVITAGAAYEARGRLVAGSPYLVMELAEGTLATQRPPRRWDALRDALDSLLGALAHAHARGIIHRDLKPANVLWVRRAPHRPATLKLSDFGLAHVVARDEGDSRGRGAGTPAYMAPEQFRGALRDFGPWTDLYALGCVAYFLVSGQRPFAGPDEEDYARAHLRELPPPLEARFPVPHGLEAWIARLMAKSPGARFRCAADASYALQQLGAPRLSSVPPAMQGSPRATMPPLYNDSRTRASDVTRIELHSTRDELRPSSTPPSDPDATKLERGSKPPSHPRSKRPSQADLPSEPLMHTLTGLSQPTVQVVPTEAHEVGLALDNRSFGPRFVPSEPPPLPETWQHDHEPLPVTLLGAGLGLFGIREVPLVGRSQECTHLWQRLADVRETGRPQLVLLEGPSGFGKTRLATWFAQRAHEVGSAEVLRAEHEDQSESGSALIGMASEHLRTRGLTRNAIKARVRRLLSERDVEDPGEWDGLAALVTPAEAAPAPEDDEVTIVRPAARFALLLRLLARAAHERPLVVLLDDVQWDPLTMYFVEYALDFCGERFPVLFVATVQEEALAERPASQATLELLLDRENVQTLRVGPLTNKDHEELVTSLLRFDSALARSIAQRTAGNPLFATQLIGDWVSRGVLELSKQGFALREGVSAQLPDDLYAVWTARVDRAVRPEMSAGAEDASDGDAARYTDGRKAMELAACLGRVISVEEWLGSARRLGLELPRNFVQRILRSQLMLTEDGYGDGGRLRFVHGMLREALERSAREAGRLASFHGAIANVLAPLLGLGEIEVAERLASHLRMAGRLEEAIGPLRLAARNRLRRAEFDRATRLLDVQSRAMAELDLPEGDREWGENTLLRAEVLLRQGALKRASRTADEAAEHGSGFLHESTFSHAELLQGLVAIEQLRFERAETRLLAAGQRFDLMGRPDSAAACLRGLARIAELRGRPLLAFNGYLTALEVSRANFDDVGAAAALVGMGQSDPGSSYGNMGHYSEALSLYEREGDLFGVALTLGELGDVAAREGRLVEGEALYRRSLRISQRIGASLLESAVTIRLTLLLNATGRPHEAQRIADVAWRMADLLGHRGNLVALQCVSLESAVEVGDWAAWEEHIAPLTELCIGSAYRSERVTAKVEVPEGSSPAAGRPEARPRGRGSSYAASTAVRQEDPPLVSYDVIDAVVRAADRCDDPGRAAAARRVARALFTNRDALDRAAALDETD